MLVVAADGAGFAAVEDDLRALAVLGCPVQLVAGTGRPPAGLAEVPFRQEAALVAQPRGRGRSRLFGRRLRGHRSANPAGPGVPAGLRVPAGSTVLVLDEQLVPVLGDRPGTDGAVRTGRDAVDELRRRRQEQEAAVLGTLDRLVRTGRHEQARRRSRRVRSIAPAGAATAEAWAAAMALTESGAGDVPGPVVAEAIVAADRAWAAGEVVRATYALGAAMRVLFHPVLHADVTDPPLAREPSSFLRPLRASTMLGALLGSGVRHPEQAEADSDPVGVPGAVGAAGAAAAGRRVLVLPGSYPRFAAPLVAALREQPGSQVSVRTLADLDRRFAWLGMNTDVLAWRVAAHPDGRAAAAIGGPPEKHADVLAGYDVIVADWADRGAMWASMVRPAGTRLVVRAHGMDLFSPWLHLIDWSRVDDLVLVSAPLRRLAQAILGDRLDGVRVHVIEHGVDPDHFTVPRSAAADRTLGMIGWGKLVKDPAWTLDVLEQLLQRDPTWRLLLVGHPLPREGDERTLAYARAFWARVDGPLAAHVELVPQTDEVAEQAARMGFVLSSSRRESFHLAVVEGALAGAVPVVRDWPVYRGGTGPGAIFPPQWVATDPAQAAARIHALSDPTVRDRAAAQARAEAVRRFDPAVFSERVGALLAAPRSR